jgi:AraC family transcriptional regulator, regulatory protein of adaptative response / methylated-DNA-[protein]-cysteine methyltransferase
MLSAVRRRDRSYDGLFVIAVKTTKIFCRLGCPARAPKTENIEFYPTSADAIRAGYRACKRCKPLEPSGATPPWIRDLFAAVEKDPARRWKDADLRAMALEPSRVARWFRANHGITFHAYSRACRLGIALGKIQEGRSVSHAAFEAGYDSISGFNEAFQQFAGGSPTQTKHATIVNVVRIETPLGAMIAASEQGAIVLLEFIDRRMLPTQFKRLHTRLKCVFDPRESPVITQLRAELDEYFAHRRSAFDVPLRPTGTPFQESVWNVLRAIPAGTTKSYSDVAKTIGRPSAVRAVARANGDNPIAILVPCHRVIGADGQLVGYGGGLWRKERLLEIEGARPLTLL